jgi:hypothetical protein
MTELKGTLHLNMGSKHHKAVIVRTDKQNPFRAVCSCGPDGNFISYEEAKTFIGRHLDKVRPVMDTKELIDEVAKEKVQMADPELVGEGTDGHSNS